MNCRQIHPLLTTIEQAADLPPAARQHLAACPSCCRLYHELQASWSALDNWSEIPVAADFRARFWQQAEAREKDRAGAMLRALSGWLDMLSWRRGLAAVTLLLLVAMGGALLRQQPQSVIPGIPSVGTVALEQEDQQLLDSLQLIGTASGGHPLEAFDIWTVSEEVPPAEGTPGAAGSSSKEGAEQRNTHFVGGHHAA